MKPLQRRPSVVLVYLCLAVLAFALLIEVPPLVFEDGAGRFLDPDLGSQLWRAFTVTLLTMAALDLVVLGRLELPKVKRTLPKNLALHDWSPVQVEVVGGATLRGDVLLFDDIPGSAESEGLPLLLDVTAGAVSRSEYRLRPMERGDARFGAFLLVGNSPLGLWRFTARLGEEEDTVRVYPNFGAVARFGALVLDHHTEQVGIKLRQRRGEGLEFHQLREYRAGDSSRQVDWKATSRKQQLVSREFQDERDQRVIFLLDGGRRMRTKDGDLSHFDHALNAMVLLSHVALRAGDAVGLLSFGEQTRWLPAKKGVATVNRILNATYDLDSSTLGSDFSEAASELAVRQSRRSLVILLTNVRPEDTDDLLRGVETMRRKHLVLVANLREMKLDEVMREPVRDFPAALRQEGAWQHRIERNRMQDTLHERGIMTLDVTPKDLPVQLINRYHAIKAAGAL